MDFLHISIEYFHIFQREYTFLFFFPIGVRFLLHITRFANIQGTILLLPANMRKLYFNRYLRGNGIPIILFFV